MTQTGFIDSILFDLGLTTNNEYTKTKAAPASQILHPDKDGADWQGKLSYHSVIGKLNYLAMNTRPVISFAVHHCAKYCSNPKLLHEKAIKHIG